MPDFEISTTFKLAVHGLKTTVNILASSILYTLLFSTVYRLRVKTFVRAKNVEVKVHLS